jgi:hypothetical protein
VFLSGPRLVVVMVNMSDPALLAYLQEATAIAATQNLTQDRRSQTINLSIAFLCIAIVFTILRFYARHKQRAGYGIDDWLIVVSLLFLGGNLATVIASTHPISILIDFRLM